MFRESHNKFRISIRLKLLLVSLSLFIIPWVGTRYIQEMESYLRQQQEEALLTRTQMIAAVLQGRPDLFTTRTTEPLPTLGVQHVFIRPLHSRIQLDGYLDDWQAYEDRMQTFDANNALKGSESTSLTFRHQLGTYTRHLYAIFAIKDDTIVYREPNSPQLNESDHLIIAMQNNAGEFVRYMITTIAPGWINAHRIDTDINNPRILGPEVRIKGEWQETSDGYNIEIRIPRSMLGDKLSFAIADVDDEQTRLTDTIISTAGIDQPDTLGTIMFPSEEAEQLLSGLQHPLTRTWAIDINNRVIARTGNLTEPDGEPSVNDDQKITQRPFFAGLISLIYKLILKQPATEFHDELLNASRLNSEEFRSAINGQPAIRWRQTPDKEVNILTATYPVYSKLKVIGAVAIEQTSNAILLIQNRAMEILINLTLLAFLTASVILLVFATRLSIRVSRLRDATENAITPDGRVVGQISTVNASDEIGDLSRSVADMLSRLAQYNRYLESMASKLSHELRTPVTVVRSSLDNLTQESSENEIQTYLQRAREGIQRLNDILTRMSEATRLEQTIQSEQQHTFELDQVISGCVEGYKLIHPQTRFILEVENSGSYSLQGSPDLIAQMLDKLVNNAIDFHEPETPIRIKLVRANSDVVLYIENTGPLLPDEMQSNLFESMVSVRQNRSEQPHLGLGLYIARLIVEFHYGRISANNLPAKNGVSIKITFPATNTAP
jgi:two-component system sensor histidine kinase ChvG